MGKFKTVAMKKKKQMTVAWPPFPSRTDIAAIKAEVCRMPTIIQKVKSAAEEGLRWSSMVIIQFPDGEVSAMLQSHSTQEDSRDSRRAMQKIAQELEGGTGVDGATPARYLGSWNWGVMDSSKWMSTVPEA